MFLIFTRAKSPKFRLNFNVMGHGRSGRLGVR